MRDEEPVVAHTTMVDLLCRWLSEAHVDTVNAAISKRVRPYLFTFLSVLSVAAPANEATAKRAIPDDNLAYPILISLKAGSVSSFGSGFCLDTSNATYLVTAKHVLAAAFVQDPVTK
jgi:hypothetical protein